MVARGETLALALVLLSASPAVADRVHWCQGIGESKVLARKFHKLILIDFHSDNCIWCDRMDADVYPDPKLGPSLANYIPVRVRTDNHLDMKTAFALHVVTHTVVLVMDPKLGVIYRVPGYVGPNLFAKELILAKQLSAELPNASTHPGTAHTLLACCFRALALDDLPSGARYLAQANLADPKHRDPYFPGAYSGIGDAYQSLGKYADAITAFGKCSSLTKDPYRKGYALISIASCYSLAGTPKKAVPALKGYLALGPASVDFAESAHRMLSGAPDFPPALRRGFKVRHHLPF